MKQYQIILNLTIRKKNEEKTEKKEGDENDEEEKEKKMEKDGEKDDVFSKQLFKGLLNEGTTCYLNSVLQLFFHIPIFRKIVYNSESTHGEIVYELQRLFYNLQKFDSYQSPVSVRKLSSSFGWSEEDYHVQHDVEELITVLLDAIEETVDVNFKDVIPFLFEIKQKQRITLMERSDFQSEKNSTVLTLRLPVRACHSIHGALFKYLSPEFLVGENKYKANDGKLYDAKKYISFEHLPPILMIQLKRFLYDPQTNRPRKITDKLMYPLELDLKKYLPGDQSGTKFVLKGVLVHAGRSTVSGHYYSYLRKSDDWYRFNDESVTKCDSTDALERNYGGDMTRSHAYMLVYVKESLEEMIYEDIRMTESMEKKFGGGWCTMM